MQSLDDKFIYKTNKTTQIQHPQNTTMTNITKAITCLLVVLMHISCTDEIDAVNPPETSDKTISGTLPVLYIDTENNAPIVSKEVYMLRIDLIRWK